MSRMLENKAKSAGSRVDRGGLFLGQWLEQVEIKDNAGRPARGAMWLQSSVRLIKE